jgi:soluble lytic murein transglycosylase-like protein
MSARAATAFASILAGIAVALAWTPAVAGVLYKCEGPNGAIAYTNKTSTFTKCVELQRYADAPVSKPKPKSVALLKSKPITATPATIGAKTADAGAETRGTNSAEVAEAPSGDAPKSGWTYRENVVEKPDFASIMSGVSSTALPLRATSFGVESTAPLVLAARKPALPVGAMVAKADPPPVAAAKPTIAQKVLRGAVYRVTRGDGITEYTNVKPAAGSAFAVLFTYIATCIACDVHSKIDFAHTPLHLDAFKDEIAAAATSYGVDAALLRAVIHAESAFNPMAVSNKGAQGLMQLMPATAGDLGVGDAFNVAQNIGGGAKYLAQLLKDFNGDEKLATAAYNAGEGAVQKYGGVPPYDETQVYVQRVAELRQRYQRGL